MNEGVAGITVALWVKKKMKHTHLFSTAPADVACAESCKKLVNWRVGR